MAERVNFFHLPVENMVGRLRIHRRLFMGYAMALAERAGLNATEAADLFVEPLLSDTPSKEKNGDIEAVGGWLELEAAAMEAVHGDVQLIREGNAWTMTVAVADDLAWLRPWNVSCEYWVGWLSAHLNRIASRHGTVATATLEADELHVRFSLAR